ncbi:hypothetical protein ABFT23_21615 [Nocardioides sp. C4-1]|uniref:hypothetical protein n=1 Tax=Nocardioides sp. C4-1 TaxID=3151851 RepID=UPI0032634B38
MVLFSRRRGRVSAVHARIADGEHLWLAVRGAESLCLVRDGGPTPGPVVDVDTEVETHDGVRLLTAVVTLAAIDADDDADDLVVRLRHGARRRPVALALADRPSSPTLETPPTADRRWQWSIHDDRGLVLRRTAREPGVGVLGVARLDDTVVVRLEGSPSTVTVHGSTLAVDDGVVVLPPVSRLGLDDLPVGTPALLEADGRAVVRTRSVTDRPNYATLLPSTSSSDVELRWLRDGRLALYRHGGTDA